LSEPQIETKGDIFTFLWKPEELQIRVSRITSHRDRTTCEILVETMTKDPGYGSHIMHSTLNLASSISRVKIAKQLAANYDKIKPEQAEGIIEQLCMRVLKQYRAGEDVVELWTNEETAPPSFKLYPMIAENEANIIFGDGGAGKSLIVLTLGMIIQLPWEINPLLLKPKQGRVLDLDWETSQGSTRYRLKALTKGFGLPDFFIPYRRCTAPLADDIESIQQKCLDYKVDTIIVDSLGMACGGDINNAEVAMRFFSAFRSLNCTGILIHHSSKEHMQNRKKKTYSTRFNILLQPGENRMGMPVSSGVREQ